MIIKSLQSKACKITENNSKNKQAAFRKLKGTPKAKTLNCFFMEN